MRRAPDSNRIQREPDIVGVTHVKTPVFLTLLPATLAVNFTCEQVNCKLAH